MSAILELVADTTKYMQGLRATGQFTDREVARMGATWAASQQRMQVASMATTAAAQRTGAATMGVGTAAKDLSQNLRKLAPALMLVDSGSGQAARALSKLGRASLILNESTLSLLGTLGPILIPLAAVAAAVAAYGWQSKIANKETQELGGAISGLSLSIKDFDKLQDAGSKGLAAFRESVRKAALETAVLTGQMGELEAKQSEAARAAALEIKPGIDAAAAAATQADLDVARLTRRMVEYRQQMDDFSRYRRSGGTLAVPLSDPTRELEAAQRRQQLAREHLEALRAERRAGQEVLTTRLALEDAEKRGRVSGRSAAREAEEQTRERARAEEELAKLRQEAAIAVLSQEDALLARQAQELEQLRALGQAAQDRGAYEAAAAAILTRQAKERADLQERLDAEAQKRDDQAAKEIEKRIEAQRRAEQELADARVGLALSVLDATQIVAQIGEERARHGALTAFRIDQAAGMATVAINTVVAASKALAQLGPIAGPIAAAGLGIVGAAQEAQIAAQPPPQFYAGGFPDERPAILHEGEAVLSRRGREVLGDEAIRAANRGEPSRGTVLVETRIDGRTIASTAARQARRGGDLSDELSRRTGRLGRRSY